MLHFVILCGSRTFFTLLTSSSKKHPPSNHPNFLPNPYNELDQPPAILWISSPGSFAWVLQCNTRRPGASIRIIFPTVKQPSRSLSGNVSFSSSVRVRGSPTPRSRPANIRQNSSNAVLRPTRQQRQLHLDRPRCPIAHNHARASSTPKRDLVPHHSRIQSHRRLLQLPVGVQGCEPRGAARGCPGLLRGPQRNAASRAQS